MSVVGGGLTGALGTVLSLVKSGTRAAFQFHQEGISLARDLGMGLNQANAYTKVLTERTQELAAKYGVTSEAIMKVQRNISETTGKQLILNDAQAEGFVQANKLVGEQTTNRFMDTIMNGMGGQVSTVQGAISKAYATAMKQGLNAQKFSKTVADNLSMANRLNFRNGIDGITRMAAMAEKFGLSMKSVETAAGQFMELDSAIEHSAHLQMLGGSIGAAFSNPLQNAYESMYDPEAFAKRMEDAMKGMATFDAKKGYATMSGINQEILRNYAKEMGLNAEEVVANAKKMAEVRYKENKFSDKLGGLQLSEDQKNFLINNGQVSEGGNELLFNGQNVNAMAPAELKKQLDKMMQFEGKSDTDILKDQATSLRSIEEAINGNLVSAIASFAKGLKLETFASEIIGGIDDVGNIAQKIGEFLGEKAHDLIESIIKGVNNIEEWYTKHEKEIKETLKKIKDIIDKVHKACSFLGNHWHELLAAIVGASLGRSFPRGKSKSPKPSGGSPKPSGGSPKPSVANPKGNVIKTPQGNFRMNGNQPQKQNKNGGWDNVSKNAYKKATKGIKPNPSSANSSASATNAATSNVANPATSASKSGLRTGLKTLGKVGKVAGVGAALAGVEIYLNNGNYEDAEKEIILNDSLTKEEKKQALSEIKEQRNRANSNSIGSTVGGIAGGIAGSGWLSLPLAIAGSYAGGFIGDAIGGWIDSSVDDEELSELIKKHKGEKQADGGIVGAKPKETIIEKHASGGIVGGNSYSGDRILTGLNSGEMVLNKDQQAQLFKFISNASNILTKASSSNGVTYYNASNRTFNSSSNNTLSNILSTIFNSNSNVVSSALNTNNNIKTIPFGENSFRKIPKSDYTEYSYNKGGEIIVKDINLNVNGTLKLDAGTVTKNLDINQLLSDTTFISSLKDLIKQSINNDINNGRFMNDIASMRGMPSQVGLWGRK